MPAIINEPHRKMTKEKPAVSRPQEFSPEMEQLRREKFVELEQQESELSKEIAESAKLVDKAAYWLRDVHSPLPYWPQHQREILEALYKAIALMRKSPAEFYPDLGEGLITERIERERRQK